MDVATLSVFVAEWTLRARVVHKGPVQQWKNKRGEGRLFHVCLVDEQGREIAATFFNAGVERFHTLIEENQRYTFAGGKVIKASDKFRLVDCDLHINFDEKATIEVIEDSPEPELPEVQITPLAQVTELARDGRIAVLTVCAIVTDRGAVREVTNRQGEIKRKRDVTVNDLSKHPMQLTLWGEESDLAIWETAEDPLVLLGIRLQTCVFNHSLMLTTNRSTSQLVFYPSECQAASDLKAWWLSTKPGSVPAPLATLASLVSEEVAGKHKVTREIVAFINYIRHDIDTPLWYESCPNPACKRKVHRLDSGFHCDRCKADLQDCLYRYCASIKLCDYTDGLWASAFDDTFEQLIGIPASKAREMSEAEPEKLNALVLDILNRQYSFTLLKTQSVHQDLPKVRYTIEKVTEVDQKSLTHTLLAELEGLNSPMFASDK